MTTPFPHHSERPATLAAALAIALLLPALRPAAADPPPPPPTAAAAAAVPEPVSYYGVYMKKAKVGSVVMTHSDVKATASAPAAEREETVMTMDLRLLGAPASLTSTSVSLVDAKTGRPISEETRMASVGGRSTRVIATFTDRTVNYVANVDGSEKSGTLTLKPGEQFLLDLSSTPDFHPHKGLKLSGKVFIAETLELTDETIEVVEAGPTNIDGQATVYAYKILETSGVSGETVSYVNEAGDMLSSTAPLGIVILKEPKDVALAPPDASAAPPDLAFVVAITPTGAPIPLPRAAREARFELSGVTRRLPLKDEVQSVVYPDGTPGEAAAVSSTPHTAVVTVTAHPLPASGGRLYPNKEAAPPDLQAYLDSTLYVSSKDPMFLKLAHQVVGDETDAAKAAAAIAAWVHQDVKPDPSIAAFRTAADVYKEPRGVCRDYTVLFTTIARAAGLPTKQCTGLVYANGQFFYHAWPEVWIGDGWVALEPTFGAPFADATHIKLSEGELTDMTRITADMGKYQIRVDEVR